MTNKNEQAEKMSIARETLSSYALSHLKVSAFGKLVDSMEVHVERWVNDPSIDVHSFSRRLTKYASDTEEKHTKMIKCFAYARRRFDNSGRDINKEAYHQIVIRMSEIIVDPDVEPCDCELLEKVQEIADYMRYNYPETPDNSNLET